MKFIKTLYGGYVAVRHIETFNINSDNEVNAWTTATNDEAQQFYTLAKFDNSVRAQKWLDDLVYAIEHEDEQ